MWLAWQLLPVDRVLERQVRDWLARRGVMADFTVSHLTTQMLAIEDLRLAPENAITAGKITASYSLHDLTQQRIPRIEITGLRLTFSQNTDGAWHIVGLETLLSGPDTTNGGFTLPRLPFDVLLIRDAQLTFRPHEGETYTASAELELYGDYSGRLSIAEAALPLGEGESILLTNLSLARETADAPFAITIGNIAHLTRKKAYFTPLQATSEITLARDNLDINGIMDITDLRGQWALKLKGSASLDAGNWNITFEQPAMAFETGILQPDMLFPILRGQVAQVGGSLSYKGEIAKAGTDADITGSGELSLQDISGVIADVPVNGVDGTVAFSSLWPPATRGKQRVSVREILLGLPLKNGTMAFALAKDGTVTFVPSTWEWADGKLHTAGAKMNIYNLRLPDITLSAKGLALEQLLGSLLQRGISATGRLDGTLPVTFTEDGSAMIRNGVLSTEGGGVIRYIPDAESPLQMGHSFQTDLLLSALENFHYEALFMTINSVTAHEMTVALHVKGRNPELYGGQTIELNINLNGNLLDIVQSGMNIYTLPERLQEQLTP